MKLKGFDYEIDEKKIEEYKNLPDEMKLKWLDEIFKFTVMCETEETKKIREKFRKGEI